MANYNYLENSMSGGPIEDYQRKKINGWTVEIKKYGSDSIRVAYDMDKDNELPNPFWKVVYEVSNGVIPSDDEIIKLIDSSINKDAEKRKAELLEEYGGLSDEDIAKKYYIIWEKTISSEKLQQIKDAIK